MVDGNGINVWKVYYVLSRSCPKHPWGFPFMSYYMEVQGVFGLFKLQEGTASSKNDVLYMLDLRAKHNGQLSWENFLQAQK